jgi:ribosome biogenesis GTPase / thiamine phosphate phosphatase
MTSVSTRARQPISNVKGEPLNHPTLEDLGWTADLAEALASQARAGLIPGRVAAQHGPFLTVFTARAPLHATVAGRLKHRAASAADLPAVGDWVALAERSGEDAGTVHAVLPRKSSFGRKVAGRVTDEQIVAANVDKVFVVSSLNSELNLRRIERYLTLAWDGGAQPVVALTKADLCNHVPEAVMEVEEVALGVPVLAVSAVTGSGMAALEAHVGRGCTVAMLGSSGVGKSTLINHMMGRDVQTVRAIRDDDRGRHTTSHRELLVLPRGGIVIDTPGMREIQLWDAPEGMRDAFADVDSLASQCRFGDCSHTSEPGCAVKEAVAGGTLSDERYASYAKLQRELAHLARKRDARLAAETARRWKIINKEMRRSRKPFA